MAEEERGRVGRLHVPLQAYGERWPADRIYGGFQLNGFCRNVAE